MTRPTPPLALCLWCRGRGCQICQTDRQRQTERDRALIIEHLGGWLRAHGYDRPEARERLDRPGYGW